MLCLPFAQRPAGTGGCLPTGGGSRASHNARCCMRAGPAGLEEQGWASLVHFADPVSAALSIPWVLASQGSGSAGLWGQGWLQGWAWRDPGCSHCACAAGAAAPASTTACGAVWKADSISCCAAGTPGLWHHMSLRHPVPYGMRYLVALACLGHPARRAWFWMLNPLWSWP